MQRTDFHFELPPELIASRPLDERSASRLLHLDARRGAVADRVFNDLPNLLKAGDLLVLNDTRVIPARLFGRKESGGRVEVLVERVLEMRRVLAHVRASKAPKTGTALLLEGNTRCIVVGRSQGCFELAFESAAPVLDVLERHGHMPLPPYVKRPDDVQDRERYQTVYARRPGAVAAPTAGLHFDEALLGRLKAVGVRFAYVTLHVGAGTFQPVRVDRLEEHRMHREYLEVSPGVCEAISVTRRDGRRVVAVGTTVVRALETAARGGRLAPYRGETDIFIYPGFGFRVVDALITNFHLPESSLVMLVSAFAGHAQVMDAYRHAVLERYRFFSYGDAMFIWPGANGDGQPRGSDAL